MQQAVPLHFLAALEFGENAIARSNRIPRASPFLPAGTSRPSGADDMQARQRFRGRQNPESSAAGRSASLPNPSPREMTRIPAPRLPRRRRSALSALRPCRKYRPYRRCACRRMESPGITRRPRAASDREYCRRAEASSACRLALRSCAGPRIAPCLERSRRRCVSKLRADHFRLARNDRSHARGKDPERKRRRCRGKKFFTAKPVN